MGRNIRRFNKCRYYMLDKSSLWGGGEGRGEGEAEAEGGEEVRSIYFRLVDAISSALFCTKSHTVTGLISE
jgi:hypothetical protein